MFTPQTETAPPLLRSEHLWTEHGLPRIVKGTFVAPIHFEDETSASRVTFRNSAHWKAIDSKGKFEFLPREKLEEPLGGDKVLVTVILYSKPSGFRRDVSFARSATGTGDTTATLPVRVGINQRDTRLRGKRSLETAAGLQVRSKGFIPQAVSAYQSWRLQLRLADGTPVLSGVEWTRDWGTSLHVDLWRLNVLQRNGLLHRLRIFLANWACMCSTELLSDYIRFDGAILPVAAPFLANTLSRVNADRIELLISELYGNPLVRLELPRKFFNQEAARATNASELQHWSGTRWRGPLVDGLLHGKGEIHFPVIADDQWYCESWKRNVPHGSLPWQGKDFITGVLFQGDFQAGIPHGQVKVTFYVRHGQAWIVYQGEIHCGQWRTRGRVDWLDGSWYEGPVSPPACIFLPSPKGGNKYRILIMVPAPGIEQVPDSTDVGSFSSAKNNQTDLPGLSTLLDLLEVYELQQLDTVLDALPIV